MNIYVASSWRNTFQPEVVSRLRLAGHEVYDFKNPGPEKTGFNWRQIDEGWQSWTPEAYREALRHPIAQAGFDSDMNALRDCQACVYVLPCGRSASLELGWASGAGKFTVVLLAPGEPELMVKMCDRICLNLDEVVAELDAQERRWAEMDIECGGGIVPSMRREIANEKLRTEFWKAHTFYEASLRGGYEAPPSPILRQAEARLDRAKEMCDLAGVRP